ncbi:MAG: extracellular solute-binding protein [Clostridia bacterium]|nr:extracellular solute-binding protein [Clostridia bacterium]
MKKLIAMMLTVMMLASLGAAFAEGKTWTDDETIELTILCKTDNIPNENNMVLEKLREVTGVKLNIIPALTADYTTKLNAMIAAGDVPDIFYCMSLTDAVAFKEAGLLANMEDVLNAVAPNVIEETKDILGHVAVNNDGVYMVPNARLTTRPTSASAPTGWPTWAWKCRRTWRASRRSCTPSPMTIRSRTAKTTPSA